ncbi:hypothetical protein C8N24_0354 [Solirubrobacter pauli]|uniref:Uncharacterized protein n=1 Tax=Solirubrobacter pauli TaxID=166793 RepID=A0A660L6A0_9ACTN|nr:hypothetical protein C8N24_0354 [Solirubrobacter pauli]
MDRICVALKPTSHLVEEIPQVLKLSQVAVVGKLLTVPQKVVVELLPLS